MKIGGFQTSGNLISSLTSSGVAIQGINNQFYKQTVIQEFYSGQVGAVALGSVTQFASTTVNPTATDGTQIFSGSVTPLSSSSKLRFSCNVYAADGGSNTWGIWLIINGTTTRMSVANSNQGNAMPSVIVYDFPVSSTSTVFFSVRIAPSTTATMRLNDSQGGGTSFGNAIESFLRVQELFFQ